MIKFCPIHEVPLNAITEKCCLCEDIRKEEEQSTRYTKEVEIDARAESGEGIVD